MKNMIDHPDHYQAEGFECIDVMLALEDKDEAQERLLQSLKARIARAKGE